MSEEQFNEALAVISADLPARLKAFLSDTAHLGVYADVRRNLSLKWRGPDQIEYHLGSVGQNGAVGTDYCHWSADHIGRVDLSHAYLADLAAIVPGGKVRQTPKPTGWRAITNAGDPPLSTLLDQAQAWKVAITRYIDALRDAILSTSQSRT